ncbi:hypothetical protein QE369_000663 [Agrobacterium larrymoorei]|uniref:Uncharacterized protein n=1 Tax=Agrobacterium larrymoorei TaxID=160699 RepID=A0AAJ2B6V8_9HYPH|nr:hypothetical protein [Agrobacterium larrymoorei]MDR6100485.1 hypothetical protein [Agrobacterium larrymoorei]
MVEQHLQNGTIDADQIRSTLTALFPHLRPFWQRPLAHYARAVYEFEIDRPAATERDDALARLCCCLSKAAIRAGVTYENARDAAAQFMAAPIIQTGPHCHLLIEPDAFYTHLFSLLGIKSRDLRWQFWYGASTVKFIEKPRKGPGWLMLEGELVNVFGLPRSRMDAFSVCGSNGPYRFTFAVHADEKRENWTASRLKSILPDGEFQSAADAIKAGNVALWKAFFPSDVGLIQIDDRDVGNLIADHLDDRESWLCRRFVEGGLAYKMLQVLTELDQGPWAGWIRRTTDLFWRVEKGRLYPLRLTGGALVDERRDSAEVKFSPAELSDALRLGELVPSLLVTFIVMSILPGTRVLGGCRQTVYYPLMRYVFACALGRAGECELLTSLRRDVLAGMWGHRVLRPENGQPLAELEAARAVVNLLSNYDYLSLEQACGNLASFTNDPSWAKMGQRMNAEDIRLDSREWQWA